MHSHVEKIKRRGRGAKETQIFLNVFLFVSGSLRLTNYCHKGNLRPNN